MSRSRGFSLVEMTVVLGLSFVLAGVAVLAFQEAQSVLSANSSEQVLNSKLRLAREIAITQRKNITVSFIAPNQIQMQGSRVLSLETETLSKGVLYGAPAGAPTNPDNLPGVVNLSGQSLVFFGDGSARDPLKSIPLNGVIFLYDPSNPDTSTASAVTIAGSTGRVRTYRYDRNNNSWY